MPDCVGAELELGTTELLLGGGGGGGGIELLLGITKLELETREELLELLLELLLLLEELLELLLLDEELLYTAFTINVPQLAVLLLQSP